MELYTETPLLGMDMFHPTMGRGEPVDTDEKPLSYYYGAYMDNMAWPQPDSTFNLEPCLAHYNNNPYVSGYDTPMQYTMEELENFKLPMQNVIQTEVPKAGLKRKRTSSSKMEANQQQISTSTTSTTTTHRPSKSPRSTCSTPTTPGVGSVRKHYAVEKRYRSTLNDRYATLARLVSQPETQAICKGECPDWELPTKLECGTAAESGKRQSKTTTLSVAIETIALLDRACARKARELEGLVGRLGGIVEGVSVRRQ